MIITLFLVCKAYSSTKIKNFQHRDILIANSNRYTSLKIEDFSKISVDWILLNWKIQQVFTKKSGGYTIKRKKKITKESSMIYVYYAEIVFISERDLK